MSSVRDLGFPDILESLVGVPHNLLGSVLGPSMQHAIIHYFAKLF